MRLTALGLAAAGVLCFAADQASAQQIVSHSTATHLAAGPAIVQSVHHGGVVPIQEVRHRHPGYRGYYRPHGPVIIHPRVLRPRALVVPVPAYPRVLRPRIYGAYPYYYGPSHGFSYSSPGFSIGFSF